MEVKWVRTLALGNFYSTKAYESRMHEKLVS